MVRIKSNKNFKLHMVGKLQTNKVKNALEIFDYIHSLDNQKLADTLSKFQQKLKQIFKIFYSSKHWKQMQKSGIPPSELKSFLIIAPKKKP